MSAFKKHLDLALRGKSLGRQGAREAMELIMSGEAGELRCAAFLGALQAGGLGAPELIGFAQVLRERAVSVRVLRAPLVDTCGTGGDGLSSFNFSTAAAFLAAGAGAAVAKHGNRSVSSRSGSADMLEALGVDIEAPPARAARSIEQIGFGFLFAPLYHPTLKSVSSLRKTLGVRTVFNMLGPLLNPALARRQVVGVYDRALLTTYARVLHGLGSERALVVCAENGMDELSLSCPTTVCRLEHGRISTNTVTPEDAGLKRVPAKSLRGGDARDNARALEALLEGKRGPLAEGTIFNAAAALLVAGKTRSLKEGVELARQSIASGKARGVLEQLRRSKEKSDAR